MTNFAIHFCFWLCAFISTFANGQSTFEYISAIADTDQFVSDAVSYGNRNMIFVGTKQGGPALQGHIFSLSSNGIMLRERTFNWHGKNTYLENILYLDTNRFLVVGAIEEHSIHHLLVCLIDTTLNELSSKELSLGPYNYFYAKSFMDHNNNVLIHGTVSDTLTFMELYPYSYKITLNLDSIQLKVFENQAWGIFDMVEKPNCKGYYYFLTPNYKSKYQGPTVLNLDPEFNITKTEHLPRAVINYNTVRWTNDSTFIFSGEYPEPDGNGEVTIGVVVSDTLMAEKYFNHFGEDTITHFPGLRRNLDFITPHQIFVGGTTNFGYETVFMNQDSWFFLNRIDSTLSLEWQKWYGKPGFYYTLWGVLATDDGGCVMYGTRYNYPTNSLTRDIVIIKVDDQGYVVSTNDHGKLQQESIKLYPNPGHDEAFVQSDLKNAVLVLTDPLGRMVCKTNLMEGKTKISTINLKPGLYLYNIIKDKMVVSSGKWIKY